MPARVLFVCVHNSGRSQMAQAFLTHLSGGSVEAESAGTMPSEAVNLTVVEVMGEIGIDISPRVPMLLTQHMVDRADRVVTMGCSIDEACPASSVDAQDWGLADPTGRTVEEVREIRDAIKREVIELLPSL